MKSTSSILLCILLSLSVIAVSSCSDSEVLQLSSEEDVSISISIPLLETSSRSYDGVETEFQVNDLTLCFFSALDFDEAHSQCLWRYILPLESSFNGTVKLSFALPMDVKTALFGGGESSCMVYAVANTVKTICDESQSAILKEDHPTVARLKSIISKSSFKDGGNDHFLMDALTELSYSSSKITGNVALERLASRFILSVHIPDSAVGFDSEGLRGWMISGVDQCSLDLNPANTDFYSQDIVDMQGVAVLPSGVSGEYVFETPLYSYPGKYVGEKPSYILLRASWFLDSSDNSVATYYSVPLAAVADGIGRNRSYEMRVGLSAPGSLERENPIELSAEFYYDLPWNKKTVDIVNVYHYLKGEPGQFDAKHEGYLYSVYDEKELTIPLYSSHPLEIYRVDVEWDDLFATCLSDTKKSVSITDFDDSLIVSAEDYNPEVGHIMGVTVDIESESLIFRREMIALDFVGTDRAKLQSIASKPQLSPYRFILHLRQIDNPTYAIKIVIDQFPALYAGVEFDSAPSVFVNGMETYSNTLQSGKGYVAERALKEGSGLYLGTLIPSAEGTVYTFCVSKTPSFCQNIAIGDPRSLSVDNLETEESAESGNWSIDAVDSETGKKRYLTHYYPTLRSESYSRLVAPRFAVSSTCRNTGALSYEQAQRRCASYHEGVRAAGRWRLPTQGEVEIIAALSAYELLPKIFDESTPYWTASGAVEISYASGGDVMSASVGGEASVICVYDDWFWGSRYGENGIFSWGDYERNGGRSSFTTISTNAEIK